MSTVTPPTPPQPPQAMPSANASQQVAGPATGLLITAIVGSFFVFIGLLINLLGVSLGTMMAESTEEQFAQWISGGAPAKARRSARAEAPTICSRSSIKLFPESDTWATWLATNSPSADLTAMS